MSSSSSESVLGCGGEDMTVLASKAMLDVLKISVYNGVANDWSQPCLGKLLCNCKCQFSKCILCAENRSFNNLHKNFYCQSFLFHLVPYLPRGLKRLASELFSR